MVNTKPVAFISFVGSDSQHDEGRIHQFRERLADDGGQGTLEDNDIFRNARAGMRIGNSGRPILRKITATGMELSLSGSR